MRIYVIGPVTGVEDGNRPAFEAALDALHAAGYTAFAPFQFVPADAPWKKAMRLSIEVLMKCDAVCALPGWEESRGACVEMRLARELGYDAFEIRTLAPPQKG